MRILKICWNWLLNTLTNKQLKESNIYLSSLLEQQASSMYDLQKEIINVLGVIATAYGGRVVLDKEIVEVYKNSNLIPKLIYVDDGSIEIFLEQVVEDE